MSSSRTTLAQGSDSGVAARQKQDSQQNFAKKPAPLDFKVFSQESASTFPVLPSAGQKTPPLMALAAATLTLEGGPKEKKIGHRRVDEQTGLVTYKKKATSDLMQSIQLGIGQSVGSLTSKPNRDVLMQDFSVVETVHFPENGSNLTPAHRVGEFTFKTYAPVAFRYFREIFGIQTDDFLISLTSLPLTELSNPGASGSVFFITEDDEFIIKTVQHKEANFLQKLLPGYYMNLNQNPRTLLPKFYGLYCLQSGGKNIRLCVMNNLLPKAIRMSEKYDLKGSTYKRKASKHELGKSSPTFKDLNFKERNKDGILLEGDTYEALMKTIKRDCMVLESFKIMDYSLLLSVYNVDEMKRQQVGEGSHMAAASTSATVLATTTDQPSTSNAGTAGAAGAEASVATPGAITRGRSTKHRLQNFSTAMESIQADVDPVELEDEDAPPGGIPARNVKGERLLLYAGIIDILQSYRLKKKLEHGFKSIVYDGDSISVHRPSFYAHRFQTFFEKEVFKKVVSPIRSPSKKKSSASRQRSLTETATAAAAVAASVSKDDNTVSSDTEGSLAHKTRPDIIPQHPLVPRVDEESRGSSSATSVDPKWSGSTITSSSSSASGSTVVHSYQGAYAKAQSGPLSSVQEREFNTSSSYAGPPLDEGPPPPYSEEAPVVSKAISLPAADDLQFGAHTDQLGKSSIRREHVERVDKKEVRFSFSEDDTLTDSEENSQLFVETHRGLGLVAAGGAVSSGENETTAIASETEDAI